MISTRRTEQWIGRRRRWQERWDIRRGNFTLPAELSTKELWYEGSNANRVLLPAIASQAYIEK